MGEDGGIWEKLREDGEGEDGEDGVGGVSGLEPSFLHITHNSITEPSQHKKYFRHRPSHVLVQFGIPHVDHLRTT